MADHAKSSHFTFPKWANYVVPVALVAIIAGAPYQLLLIGFALNPTTLNVGYQPKQPIQYSHKLHANTLGIDCRYCHTTVEESGFAAVPPTQTCMNCHHAVRQGTREGSEKEIAKLVAYYESGEPIPWVKIHDLADYSYFAHSPHVNAGVSCKSCHGQVNHMDGQDERVWQVESLSMGWCLSCHRNPTPYLRPVDQVTNLEWGVSLTEAQVDQIRNLTLDAAQRYSFYGEALAGDDVTAMNESFESIIGELKVGDDLEARHLEAIGKMQAARLGIRPAALLQDCSICHR